MSVINVWMDQQGTAHHGRLDKGTDFTPETLPRRHLTHPFQLTDLARRGSPDPVPP